MPITMKAAQTNNVAQMDLEDGFVEAPLRLLP